MLICLKIKLVKSFPVTRRQSFPARMSEIWSSQRIVAGGLGWSGFSKQSLLSNYSFKKKKKDLKNLLTRFGPVQHHKRPQPHFYQSDPFPA